MVTGRDEELHLRALRGPFAVMCSTDDGAHFGGHDVAVGVHGNEERAPLQRKADSTPRRRRSGGRAHAQRLALELEQLLGVHLSSFGLDTLEDTPLGRRKLGDLLAELLRVSEDVPGRLERQGEWRGGRSPQVVRGDRAHRLELRLGEERPHPARIFAFPRLQLNQVGRRENELDTHAAGASEHEPSSQQGLQARRDGRHDERTARLRHPVHELHAGGV